MAEELPFKKTMIFAYGEPRELAPGVVRIVANNPNHFTFKGTNTYLVGTRSLALIDPGPDDPAHLEAVLRTVGPRRISHVVITHTHRDHTDGMPALLAAIAGAKTVGFGRRIANRVQASEKVYVDYTLEATNKGLETSQGEGLLLEASYFGLCAATEDKKEGTTAFLEKRAPQFHGR